MKLTKLKRAQVETFLQTHGRDTPNLLAAFVATFDVALLQEAVENYPNDPLA